MSSYEYILTEGDAVTRHSGGAGSDLDAWREAVIFYGELLRETTLVTGATEVKLDVISPDGRTVCTIQGMVTFA